MIKTTINVSTENIFYKAKGHKKDNPHDETKVDYIRANNYWGYAEK